MKKSLLALAVLGAFAGAASAQTNVTIYGVFDIGLTSARSDTSGGTRIGLDSGNQSGSRLGFKGTEDLGGGLSAVFTLENGYAGDTGNLGQGGRIFGRQAYVGLNGGFGSVKLGRQYMPAFLAVDSIDPFGTGNAGDATGSHFDCRVGLGANILCAIDVRMSNTINYSIGVGGVSGQLAYGLGEVAGDNSANRQVGLSLGYANGPINVVLAYHNINNATGDNANKATILGGTYNFGPATVHLALDEQKNENAAGATTRKTRDWLLGVSAPVGAGNIHASYIRGDDRLASNVDSNLAAIGYTHSLSKRTNIYTSYGRVNTNSQKQFDLGIRHKF